jgi:hypothetical protein
VWEGYEERYGMKEIREVPETERGKESAGKERSKREKAGKEWCTFN